MIYHGSAATIRAAADDDGEGQENNNNPPDKCRVYCHAATEQVSRFNRAALKLS